MLSYRHAYHAGNHADVLKHLTLVATLRHLLLKPAPLTLVDTHAGAGLYRLDSAQARTAGEAAAGIEQLKNALRHDFSGDDAIKNRAISPPDPARSDGPSAALAPCLRDYLDVVASFNTDGRLRNYPGSPLLMQRLMRGGQAAGQAATPHGQTQPDPAMPSSPDRLSPAAAGRDRLRLFELHPTDAPLLAQHMAHSGAGRAVSVVRQDGFDALKALLPPPPGPGGSRRALVLIDPSYEIKTDYAKVGACVQDALRRLATGVYLVWYPIIGRPEAHELPRRLRTLSQQAGRAWLHATLSVGAENDGSERTPTSRPGLRASGMWVINPPHPLQAQLTEALPQLAAALGRGRGQGWYLQAS